MKGNNLFLIITVLATLGIGIFLITRYNSSAKPAKLKNASPSALEMVKAQILLEPLSTSLTVGEKGSFIVSVDPGQNQVVGVETEFNYDTKKIKIDSFEVGNYFEKPAVLEETVDPKAGKINYSLGSFITPKPGKGVVFKINFTALSNNSGITNVLSFDQTNTKMALKNTQNTLYTNAQITLVFDEKPISILP